ERGEADLVLCGGADSMVNPLGIGGLARIGAPSPRNEPDACRPFDRRRDGLAIGEGGAAFVVEDESQARSRGAQVRARLLGWGSTSNGALGHLIPAAGAIELAACLLAFERGLLAGTAHHRERDPDCPIDVIGERPRRARVEVVLSNSFGFGGQNVTVALGNPED